MLPSDLSPDFLRILASLAKLVVLAMLLERALVMIFDYKWFKETLETYGLKAPVAFVVSWVTCNYYNFDVLSTLFEPDKTSGMGIFITAAIVSGGSAAAITLFQGVFKFSKEAQDTMKEANKAEADARKARAEADKKTAEADSAEAERKLQAAKLKSEGDKEAQDVMKEANKAEADARKARAEADKKAAEADAAEAERKLRAAKL